MEVEIKVRNLGRDVFEYRALNRGKSVVVFLSSKLYYEVLHSTELTHLHNDMVFQRSIYGFPFTVYEYKDLTKEYYIAS